MPTRTITGLIKHDDGSAWDSGIIKFELLRAFETSTEFYPIDSHSEVLDVDGTFSITLGVPDTGTACYRIITPDGHKYTVFLADGPATVLATLLTIASSPIEQSALQTVIDAHVAAIDPHILSNIWSAANQLILGNYHLWVDSDGYLRMKNGIPTGDADGEAIGTEYWERIRNLFGSNLIAYYPMWELGGNILTDISGRGNSLTKTGAVTIGASVGIDNKPCPTFAGGYFDLYSADLASVWNGDEFTIGMWVKFTGLTDDQYILRLFSLPSWQISIDIDPSNGMGRLMYYSDTENDSGEFTIGEDIWVFLVIVRSKIAGELRIYANGSEQIIINTSTWSGTLDNGYCTLGASIAGALPLIGSVQHLFIANTVITKAQISSLCNPYGVPKGISALGDSITPPGRDGYLSILCSGYNNGLVRLYYHAYPGDSIMADMADQVTASTNDDADIIIIELGSNDSELIGDQAAIQAEIEEQVAILKISNPRATIYYMNVLPEWTGGGTPVDRPNIRATIIAACTAQGITCWNTYTTPWITFAQTSDGVHPNAAGHAAIAAQVLALLP